MATLEKEQSLYILLGVDNGSTLSDIKAGYRSAVKRVHPDAGGDAAEFRAVNFAYEVLRDSRKRADYDSGTCHDPNMRDRVGARFPRSVNEVGNAIILIGFYKGWSSVVDADIAAGKERRRESGFIDGAIDWFETRGERRNLRESKDSALAIAAAAIKQAYPWVSQDPAVGEVLWEILSGNVELLEAADIPLGSFLADAPSAERQMALLQQIPWGVLHSAASRGSLGHTPGRFFPEVGAALIRMFPESYVQEQLERIALGSSAATVERVAAFEVLFGRVDAAFRALILNGHPFYVDLKEFWSHSEFARYENWKSAFPRQTGQPVEPTVKHYPYAEWALNAGTAEQFQATFWEIETRKEMSFMWVGGLRVLAVASFVFAVVTLFVSGMQGHLFFGPLSTFVLIPASFRLQPASFFRTPETLPEPHPPLGTSWEGRASNRDFRTNGWLAVFALLGLVGSQVLYAFAG